jgi:hypothetical protein
MKNLILIVSIIFLTWFSYSAGLNYGNKWHPIQVKNLMHIIANLQAENGNLRNMLIKSGVPMGDIKI